MSLDRLVLGTSTFVAGKLRPGKDSRPGIEALAVAFTRGLRAVHSNPNLGTQWAVREAEDRAGCRGLVCHFVKVQLRLDLSDAEMDASVDDALCASVAKLGIEFADTAVIEADLKRTSDLSTLVNRDRLSEAYSRAARRALTSGLAQSAVAFCHSPAHLLACLQVPEMAGYAAQYNLIEAWPGLFLDHIAAQGRNFYAMAPLHRGRLISSSNQAPGPPLYPLRWALGHSGVSAAVLTVSSLPHLDEAAQASQMPVPEAVVRSELEKWKRGEPLATAC